MVGYTDSKSMYMKVVVSITCHLQLLCISYNVVGYDTTVW